MLITTNMSSSDSDAEGPLETLARSVPSPDTSPAATAEALHCSLYRRRSSYDNTEFDALSECGAFAQWVVWLSFSPAPGAADESAGRHHRLPRHV